MSLLTVLAIVLLVVLVLSLPQWPHAVGWGYGYYPSGIIGVVLVILLVVLLFGYRF